MRARALIMVYREVWLYRSLVLSLFFSSLAYGQMEVVRGDFGPFGRSLNDRSYGYQVLSDTTGKAPVQQVELFKVNSGDCGSSKTWNDCSTDRERSEISEKNRPIVDNQTFWYGWSFYLPESYQSIFPAKVAFGQFHQDGGTPLWMFQHGSKGLYLEAVFLDKKRQFHLIDESVLKGRWHRVEMEIRWATSSEGFLKIWIDGVEKAHYQGPTKQKHPVYFKYGLYRSFLQRYKDNKKSVVVPGQEVYFANVKKGKTRESLKGMR